MGQHDQESGGWQGIMQTRDALWRLYSYEWHHDDDGHHTKLTFVHHYKAHSNNRGNNCQCLCKTVPWLLWQTIYSQKYSAIPVHTQLPAWQHSWCSYSNAFCMTLKQPMHINDGTNQHTYPWIMNRKRDMKGTRIQFNIWVSFLTATKL